MAIFRACCFCKKAKLAAFLGHLIPIMSDRGTDAKFSGERVHMEAAHPWQDVKFLHFFYGLTCLFHCSRCFSIHETESNMHC